MDCKIKKAAYIGCSLRHPDLTKEYATMRQDNSKLFQLPAQATPISDPLTEILQAGARKLLAQAVEAEIDTWMQEHHHLVDENGHRLVVRNGYAKSRKVVTGIGEIQVTMPRAHDFRPPEEREMFSSKILPSYMRKAKSIEELIPWLYLKGISTGDFNEALQSLLGLHCPGLSSSTIVRLKQTWEDDLKSWQQRDLSIKNYVYFWADGIHFNVRIDEDRACMLVLMGATADGRKELIAVEDGYAESEHSWKCLLLDVKKRGLEVGPKLATADGALGFWKALPQVFPDTKSQRCWVHKTANVLGKLPKRLQPRAKDFLHQIWMADTKSDAQKELEHFIKTYGAKFPKAADCLAKDQTELLAFYDFPAEHWKHIRTTNPIESMFATVRLRTKKTKGCGSRLATLTMVFKLAESASKRWNRLSGHTLLGDVLASVKFIDGVKEQNEHAA